IKTVVGPNDFAMMQEVVRRRFRRAKREDVTEDWRQMPDLVIVDGGKGQLNAALEVLREIDVHVPIVGLAKENEELFLPGRSEPVILPRDAQSLFLVQRIRDEAHRFAITFHRQRRQKASITSALDDLKGIGPRRKRALLQAFGSVKRIREASVEELAAVEGIGPVLAEQIKAELG
ncbi:MAG: excinuclease ABC subunit C, partial [Thermomicrobiaceae bacterium]|nr:excinuclease ABC subunit C [Thermomicrobiaceae bacterium]